MEGRGRERNHTWIRCTWPPPVEPPQTLFLLFFFFFFLFFISDRIATSNFLFSILDQGNPWKWTSLLELVLKGHHAGECSLLSLCVCTSESTPEYCSSKRDAIPPIRNPCSLERGRSSSKHPVRGVRLFAPNHVWIQWRYRLHDVFSPSSLRGFNSDFTGSAGHVKPA